MSVICSIDDDGKFSGSRVSGFNNHNLPQLTFRNIAALY